MQDNVIQYHGAQTGRWPSTAKRTHTVYPTKYVVVTGTLDEGFTFYGSFTTAILASDWADLNLKREVEHRVLPLNDVRNGS